MVHGRIRLNGIGIHNMHMRTRCYFRPAASFHLTRWLVFRICVHILPLITMWSLKASERSLEIE